MKKLLNALMTISLASLILVGCEKKNVDSIVEEPESSSSSQNDSSTTKKEESSSSNKESSSTNKESSSSTSSSSQKESSSEAPTLYTITFLVDGEIYYSVEAERNASVELPADPVKEGYSFTGWSGYSTSFKVRSNKTFTAQFEKTMSGLPTADSFQTPTTTSLSQDGYTVNVYEAKKVTTSIDVDGIIDDAYLAATPIEIAATCDGVADATGFAYIVWDSNYIYCFATVNDTDPQKYANGETWFSDSVEFVLDTYNKSTYKDQHYGDGYRGGDYKGEGQFRVNAGGTNCTGTHWMYDDAGVSKTVASRIVDGQGYTAEFKIDWASFKSQAAAGKQVAFAILINNGVSNVRTGVTGVEAGHIHAFEWVGVLSKLNLVD